jgi:hypothetical protein
LFALASLFPDLKWRENAGAEKATSPRETGQALWTDPILKALTTIGIPFMAWVFL